MVSIINTIINKNFDTQSKLQHQLKHNLIATLSYY